MYREFAVRCSREHLVQLSDSLNDLLDFDGGEDFEKLAEVPRKETAEATAAAVEATAVGDGEENEICKTDRKGICSHLDWMCRYLQREKEEGRLSTVGENKIRLMKRLMEKLEREADRAAR